MQRTAILVCALVLIASLPALSADHGDLTYQGLLTDDAGDLVPNGSYEVIFTVWDALVGGNQLWSQMQTIQTESGQFVTVLVRPFDFLFLPDAVVTHGPFYLQTEIMGEPGPITPRTRLTGTYSSILTHRIDGDVLTTPGRLEMVPNGPPVSDCTYVPLELAVDRDITRLRMKRFDPASDCTYFPLELVVDSAGTSMGLRQPSPGPVGASGVGEGGIYGSVDAASAIFEVFGIDPEPFRTANFSLVAESLSTSLRLQHGRDNLPAIAMGADADMVDFSLASALASGPGVRVHVDATTGPSLSVLDEIGQVMGVEPVPFNEAITLRLMDPGDGRDLLALTGNHMTNESVIRMSDPTDGADLFRFSASASSGPSIAAFDKIGQVMGVEPQPFNQGYGMRLFRPTDGQALASLSTSYAVGADATGQLSVYNPTAMVESHVEPGQVMLKYSNAGADGPEVQMTTDADVSMLMMQGPLVGASRKMITMSADNTEARVGINSDAPTSALYVDGDIVATGSITEISDLRLKSNVVPIEDALGMLGQIRGVQFEWRRDAGEFANLPEGTRVGLIAQEIERVLPEAVVSPESGYKSVDYSRLTPVLVEAIKAQQEEIRELKSQVAQLEALVTR